MAGTQLRPLVHESDIGGGSGLPHLLRTVSGNDDDAVGIERASGIEHVRDQRPAGEGVQHLGQRGVHALAQTRCEAQALFRFARVPYLAAAEPDGSRILGDLRYDRKRGLDFSDIRLMRAPGGCPAHVPPWRSPRTDILSEQN